MASGRRYAEVSFDVRPGEIFVFLGPNGGGKTTLFRLLSTLIPLQARRRLHMLGLDLRRQIAGNSRTRSASCFNRPASIAS